jgi:Ca-activated chloride channel family protein
MNTNIASYQVWRLCAAIVFLLGIAGPLLPQKFPDLERIRPERIRVESALVTVPVMVSDPQGRFLAGLDVNSFKLFQDGDRVPISIFLTSEDPIRIALLLDASVSTTTVLGKIKKAATRFLRQMRNRDLAMVVSFSTEVEVLCRLSSDPEELEDAIKSTTVGGGLTKMRDAIHEVISRRLGSASGRKAIILLTDGQDHGSKISAPELLDSIASSGTLIYSVFYSVDPRKLLKELAGISSRIPREADERGIGPYADWKEQEERAALYLEEISELSAGRFYRSKVAKLDDAFKQISEDLRSQYLLGFYPEASKLDGSMHALVVSVTVPNAVVRNRRSYRAAAEGGPQPRF